MVDALNGRWLVLVIVVLIFAPGCSHGAAGAQHAPDSRSAEPLDYTFAGLEGQEVTAQQFRGRVTVLLFMTTFDVASQAEARRLEDLYRLHTPRLNAVGLMVEAPRYVDLAREFKKSVGLSYPIAMADPGLLAEHPELRLVQSVPAWIFLDREGRVVSSAVGTLTPDQLRDAARGAE